MSLYPLAVTDPLYAMHFEYVGAWEIDESCPTGCRWVEDPIPIEGKRLQPPFFVSDDCTRITSVYCDGLWWELTNRVYEPSFIDVSISQIGILESSLDGRIAGCKEYLLERGITAQEGYKVIGSPTKSALWKLLQEHDSKLFNAGKDDLFRKPKLIGFSFNIGRSKDTHA
jgi:hypothetical protein